MAQNVLITPASTKVAFTDAGDVTTVLRTSSGRFEFKDSGESSFVDLYANDIVLDGNLTVGGTTTTVNTSSVLIEDPILQLAKGQTSGTPTVDIGFLGLRGSSQNAGFIWDESDDVFAAILTTGDGSGTTLTPASYAGFKAGAATFSGTVSSSITGTQFEVWGATSGTQVHFRAATAGANRTQLQLSSVSQVGTIELFDGANNAKTKLVGSGLSYFTGGSVGIGTASPGKLLHLYSSTADTVLKIESDLSGGYPIIDLDGVRTSNGALSTIQTYNAGDTVAAITVERAGANDAADMYFRTQATGGGNTERMRITSDGKVGIGTASPSAALHVSGTDNNNLIISKNTGTNTPYAYMQANVAGTYFGSDSGGTVPMHIMQEDASYITISTTAAERMRIAADGNVGIGTTNPGFKLDLRDATATLNLQSTTLTNRVYISLVNKATNDYFYFGKNGATHSLITNSVAYAGIIGMWGNTDPLQFATNDKVAMTIDGSQRIGLGKSYPSTKLVVQGIFDASATPSVSAPAANSANKGILITREAASGWGTGHTYGIDFGASNSIDASSSYKVAAIYGAVESVPYYIAGKLGFYTTAGGNGSLLEERMTIRASGNVGIGTASPSKHLHIYSSTSTGIRLDRSGNYWDAKVSAAYGLQFNNGSDRIIFDANGNVGIGTTAPSQVFEIYDGTSHMMYNGNINMYADDRGLYVRDLGGTVGIQLLEGTSDCFIREGNFGIGTTAPAVRLHLDSGATTELRIDGEGHELITFHKSSAQKGLVGYSIGDSTLKLCAGSGTIASNVNGISINANGNVGIGTSAPNNQLHIVGDNGDQLKLDNDGDQWSQVNFAISGTNKMFVGLDHSNHIFAIGAQGSYSSLNYISFRPDGANDDMVIKRDGNVGIGTTTPGGKLDLGANYIVNEQGRQDHIANTLPSPYYRFDGVDDYVSLGLSPNVWATSAGSFSIWFKAEALEHTDVFQIKSSYTDYLVLRLDVSGAIVVHGELGNSGYSVQSTSENYYSAGEWIHVAATCEGTGANEVKLYVNGVLANEGTMSAWTAHLTSPSEVRVGRSMWYHFNGEIKDFRWHNVALDSTEVKEAYSGASVPFKYKGSNQTKLVEFDFASSSGWALTNSTIASGVFTLGGNSSSYGYKSVGVVTEKGKKYATTYEIVSNNQVGGTLRVEGDVTNKIFNSHVIMPDSVGVHTVYSDSYTAGSGSLFMISLTGSTSGTVVIDNVHVTRTGAVAEYDGSGMTGAVWFDKSGNKLNGTVTGASLENRATALPSEKFYGTDLKVFAPTPASGDAHYLRLRHDNSEGLVQANRGDLQLGAQNDVYTLNNFGIGTTSPSKLLEVNGSVRATNSTSGGKSYFYMGAVKPLETYQYDVGGMSAIYTTSGWNSLVVSLLGPALNGYSAPLEYIKFSSNGTNQLTSINGNAAIGVTADHLSGLMIDAALSGGNASDHYQLLINGDFNIHTSGHGMHTTAGIQVNDATESGPGFIYNKRGIVIAEQTAGEDNINLLIGTIGDHNVPSSDYSIYSASTRPSYFAGSVGIGTTSPSERLDLATGKIIASRGEFTTSTHNENILKAHSTLNASSNLVSFTTTSGGFSGTALYVSTSGSGKAAVFEGGNVGIGTTAPAYELQVAGTMDASAVRAGGYQTFQSGKDSSSVMGWNASCSSPASDGKYIPDYNPGHGMVLMTASGGSADLDFRSHSWNNSSTPVSRDAFTQIMRLDAQSGNVGIGTTAPGSYKLYVNGNQYVNGDLQVSTGGVNIILNTPASDYAEIQFRAAGVTKFRLRKDNNDEFDIYGDALGGSAFHIKADGNVGIGTTAPAIPLEIKTPNVDGGGGWRQEIVGGFTSNYTSYRAGLGVDMSGATWGAAIMTSGTTRLWVGNNGNVGIGTTSPIYQLHLQNNSDGGKLLFERQDTSLTGQMGEIAFGQRTYDDYVCKIRATLDSTATGGANTGGFLSFDTEASGGELLERFRIKADGSQDHKGNRIVNSQTVNDLHRTAEPSLRFDGENANNNQVLAGVPAIWGGTSYTVQARVKLVDTGGAFVATKYQSWNNTGGFAMVGNWVHIGSGSAYQAFDVQDIALNVWTDVTLVVDYGNSLLKYYYNGVEVHSAAITIDPPANANSQALSIGSWGATNQGVCNGEVKEVRIHNRVMSPTEIAVANSGEATPFKYDDTTPGNMISSAQNYGGEGGIGNWGDYLGGGDLTSSSTYAHAGSNSIKFVGGWAYLDKQYMGSPVTGKAYRLSLYYRAPTVTTKFRIAIGSTNGFNIADSTGVLEPHIQVTSAVSSWTKFEKEFVWGAAGTAYSTHLLMYADGAELYVDSIVLEEIGEVAAYTPQTISDEKWRDATSNANHGTISGATRVNPIRHATFEDVVTNRITFPATQSASSDPNSLDDFEEGTWTPAFSNGAAGYQTQTGTYTKIGNIVQVEATIRTTSLTGSGAVTITGLPFTFAKRNPVSIWCDSWGTAPVSADAVVNTTTIALYRSNGTNGNGVATLVSDMLANYNITTINLVYRV